MKNIIKKIGIAIFAMMLVVGGMVVGNEQKAFADGENFTVIFHYEREDANYANFKITAWTPNVQGSAADFTVTDSGATYTYNCVKEQELVSFIIQSNETPNTEIDKNREFDISGIEGDTVHIYVKANVEEFTISTVEQTTTETSVQPTASTETTGTETTGTETTDETTVKKVVADDPNADYSVGLVKVVIIDVIGLAAIAAGSYAIFSREKKPKLK